MSTVTLSADKYAKFAVRPKIGKPKPPTPTQRGGPYGWKPKGTKPSKITKKTGAIRGSSLWPSVEQRLINAGFSVTEAREIANLRYTSLIASCATS